MITKAKIFKNGRSQAVRIPKSMRFKEHEVFINKLNDILIIIPNNKRLSILKNSLDKFSNDFMETRMQPASKKKENL